MYTLQEYEQAEERVHAWHGEMSHCMDEQQAQAHTQRRSWLAAIANCLGYVGGWHLTPTNSTTEAPTNHRPVRSSR